MLHIKLCKMHLVAMVYALLVDWCARCVDQCTFTANEYTMVLHIYFTYWWSSNNCSKLDRIIGVSSTSLSSNGDNFWVGPALGITMSINAEISSSPDVLFTNNVYGAANMTSDTISKNSRQHEFLARLLTLRIKQCMHNKITYICNKKSKQQNQKLVIIFNQ